jgi:hypothetical protein
MDRILLHNIYVYIRGDTSQVSLHRGGGTEIINSCCSSHVNMLVDKLYLIIFCQRISWAAGSYHFSTNHIENEPDT